MLIDVKTTSRFNAVGWSGAVLLVGSPLLAAQSISDRIESIARGIYLLPGSDIETGPLIWTTAFCSLVTLLGLVMVIVGREHQHKICIERPEEADAPRAKSS